MKLIVQIAVGVALGLLIWNNRDTAWSIALVLLGIALAIWIVANIYNRLGPRLTRYILAKQERKASEVRAHELTPEDHENIRRIAAGEDLPPSTK